VGVAVVVVTGLGSSGTASVSQPSPTCRAAPVHYTPYPGGAGALKTLPWIRGEPSSLGLVGLLWYWPEDWMAHRVGRARIFTGGEAPAGYSTKVMWVFTSSLAKRVSTGGSLVVQGQRLDGFGRSWQRFTEISYEGRNGAPSYASIIRLATPGCWRLRLTAGGLRATVTMEAVPSSR
jgi:hypothetical protein